MKYTINVDSVFFFEGAKIEVEASEEECVSSLKCVEKIYSELGKMMMQSMMPATSTPCTCQSTCTSSSESSNSSFKEVEEPKESEEKPAPKKEKKIAVD